jgi:RNA polymerase sigma-70 factor (ECF subfamily)
MDSATRRQLHEAILRLADGDRTRFPDVFAELWPRVLRFVSRTLGEAPDAEDVAQRVLINVFFRIAEFDPSRDAVAWVFGVAAWEVRTHLKQRQRRREVPALETASGPEAGTPSPEALAIQHDLEAALEDALGALTPADRAALAPAAGIDGRSTPASAATRKRRQRALARLRSIWSQRYD